MRAPYREFSVAVPCVTFPAAVFPFRMATRMITKGGGQFGTSMNLGGAPPMGSSWEGGHCYLYTHANCCPWHAPSRQRVVAAGKLDFLLRMQICPTITFTFPSKKAAALAGAVSAHSAGVVLHSARLRNCASPGKFGVVVADFDVSL